MSFPAPDLGDIKMELFAGWNWFLFCLYQQFLSKSRSVRLRPLSPGDVLAFE